jgi:hypothetical protein
MWVWLGFVSNCTGGIISNPRRSLFATKFPQEPIYQQLSRIELSDLKGKHFVFLGLIMLDKAHEFCQYQMDNPVLGFLAACLGWTQGFAIWLHEGGGANFLVRANFNFKG